MQTFTGGNRPTRPPPLRYAHVREIWSDHFAAQFIVSLSLKPNIVSSLYLQKNVNHHYFDYLILSNTMQIFFLILLRVYYCSGLVCLFDSLKWLRYPKNLPISTLHSCFHQRIHIQLSVLQYFSRKPGMNKSLPSIGIDCKIFLLKLWLFVVRTSYQSQRSRYQ